MSTRLRSTQLETTLASRLSHVLEDLEHWFAAMDRRAREKSNRKEIQRLMALDDWQLADMGITRDDVRSALMQPLDKNSGQELERTRKRRIRKAHWDRNPMV